MASATVEAQRIANEANIHIAEMTNQNQIDLMREQNQWNLDQWNRENQYNSPAAQRARLEAAGINPLLLDDWSDIGSAASVQAVTPPSLTAAHVEPEIPDPQRITAALQQVGQAFKNFADFGKSMSETGLNTTQFAFMQDMANKGYNPEIIKARTSLEMFNQLITQGKYQVPQIEAIIRNYNQQANYHAWAAEERRETCDQIRAEVEGIKFNNKFNKDKAPLELAKLAVEVRDIAIGTNVKQDVAEAQINLADKQAGLASAQTGLVGQQTETEAELTEKARLDNAIGRLRAGLADIGINPDDKHLPFFMGLGLNIANNKINVAKVSDFFDAVGYAEKIGWSNLYDSNANLTRYQLYGEPQGPLGVSGMLQQYFKDAGTLFQNWFQGKPN